MRLRLLGPVIVLLVVIGCAPPANYGKSVYGTNGYSMKNVHATPASLMVQEKIRRPLLIVLDPAKVRDVWELHTSACETGGEDCEQFKLTDFHEFVRRDLRHAMEAYFMAVDILEAPAPLPRGDYVIADVKVDAIKLRPMVTGFLTHTFIQMTWSFALRRSDAREYAYSFAGTAESNDSYPTFEAGCAQLVENAIPAMVKKWAEDGGMKSLTSET